MSTKLKALTLGLTAMLGISTFALSAAPALAEDDINQTCTDWQVEQGLCEPGLRNLTLTIINWFLFFLGLLATAFLIYGGFLYITSAGNDDNVNKAKKIIIYAAIGIVLILVSAVLVNALVNMISGGVDNPNGGGSSN